MTGELEIPENLSEWTKGGITEAIGTDEEHTDEFYRFGNLGAEQDKDGSWEAYAIVDGHPIKVKGELMSFEEVVEFFKGSFCSKRLADENCDESDDIPDVDEEPEFPDDGEMGITIMLKSITDMMREDYDGDCAIRKSKGGNAKNYWHPKDKLGTNATSNSPVPNNRMKIGEVSRKFNDNPDKKNIGKTSEMNDSALIEERDLSKYFNRFNNPGIAKVIHGLGPNDNLDMSKHKIPVIEDEYGMLIPDYPESYNGPRLPILHDRMTPQQLRWAMMAYGGHPYDKNPTLLKRTAFFPYRVNLGKYANDNLRDWLDENTSGIIRDALLSEYGKSNLGPDDYPERPRQEALDLMLNVNPDNDRVTSLYRTLAPRKGTTGAIGDTLQAVRRYMDGDVEKEEIINLLNPGALLAASEQMLSKQIPNTAGTNWGYRPHWGTLVPDTELYSDFVAEMKEKPPSEMKEYLRETSSHDIMGFKNPNYKKVTAPPDPPSLPVMEGNHPSMDEKMKQAQAGLPAGFKEILSKESEAPVESNLGEEIMERDEEFGGQSENPLMKSIKDMIQEKSGMGNVSLHQEDMTILNENPRAILIGSGKVAIPDPQHMVARDVYRTYSVKDFPENFPGRD